MNVSLTPELERIVQEKVASGLYDNASEVIREALRLLLQKDEMGRLYQDWLVAEIESGWSELERGETLPYDLDSIVAEAKAGARS